MVFVTGDTHFPIDSEKLFKSRRGFVLSKMTRKDIVIVLGDFGLFWKKGTKNTKKQIQQVLQLPYTLLFLDGNHENFTWLEEFPIIEKFGGKVQYCGENIYHLMRGELYKIQEQQFFVCGGAASTDKEYRTPYVSWWPQEDISSQEERYAMENLDQSGPIDFILTHTCPQSIIEPMFKIPHIYDKTAYFLDSVKERLLSAPWYFGHWHEDKNWGRFHAVYNRIIQVA